MIFAHVRSFLTIRSIGRVGLAFALLCPSGAAAQAGPINIGVELCVTSGQSEQCYQMTSYIGSVSAGAATITVRCRNFCQTHNIDKATLNDVDKDLDADFEAAYDIGALTAGSSYTIDAEI